MKSICSAILLTLIIGATASAQVQFDIPGMPAPGEPKPWSPPEIHEDVLPNGLRVLYTRVSNVPVIDMNFIVDAGTARDPEGKSGVAFLTSEMLLAGTTEKSNIRLSGDLSYLGTLANNGVGYNSSQFYFSALKENFPQSLSLAMELLTKPAFDSSEFQKRKEKDMNSVVKVIDNPADMTTRTLLKTLFDDNVPYAYAPHGRYRDVYGLTLEDCKEFYRTHYLPNNTTLVLTGDVDYPALRTLLIDRLGGWEEGNVPDRTVHTPSITSPRIIVINDQQVSQALFRIGYACTSRGSKDFETLVMMNEVLGADRSSRLSHALMGARKLTPYIVSGPSFQRDNGYFVVSGSIPSRYVDTALTVVFETIESMQTTPSSVEELFEARKIYTDNFDLEFATSRKVQEKIHELVAYGLPTDYFQGYLERFRAVTAEDIQSSAGVLFMSPWVAVITGDAQTIAPALEKRYGVPVEVILPNDVISKDAPQAYESGSGEE